MTKSVDETYELVKEPTKKAIEPIKLDKEESCRGVTCSLPPTDPYEDFYWSLRRGVPQ